MSARTRGSFLGGGGLGDYKYIVISDGTNSNTYDYEGNVKHSSSAVVDETEINWAMANLTAGRTSKERVVVKGEFTIDATIALVDYCVLDLYEAQITAANGLNTHLITGNDDDYVCIFGGHFYCNRANQNAGDCISLTDCNNVIIQDTHIEQPYRYGISADGSADYRANIIISHNYIFEAGSGGIYTYAAANRPTNILIEFNIIDGNNVTSGNGIAFGSGAADKGASMCIGNIIQDLTTAANGIYAAGFQSGVYDNYIGICDTTYSCGYGISISGAEMVVVGNRVWYCNNCGIYVNGYAATVSGNMSCGNRQEGIKVNSYDNAIVGNSVNDNSKGQDTLYDDIYLTSSALRCNVTGNQCRNASQVTYPTRHGILVAGNFNTVSGNFCYSHKNAGIAVTGTNNSIVGNVCQTNTTFGIDIQAGADYNSVEANYTNANGGCANVVGATCDNNMFTNNQFDEGNIADAGTNTRAWLNYDPSANTFITTINAPAVVGGGGGALP